MKKNKKTKNQVIVVPTRKKTAPKTKTKKIKTSPVAYYNCLLASAQNNWYDPVVGKKQKITACCRKCKLNAPSLNETRNQEIKKLILSYQQVGDSLKKLLQPLN